MTVPVRRFRSAFLSELDDTWPRLLGSALFWVSTALLAVVLLIEDPVFGSFVVGIPLLVVVLVRERGLAGVSSGLLGAAIGSSLMFSVFLGQTRGVSGDGLLIAGFVVLVIWTSTYPVMLRQMDRQHLRERREDAAPPPTTRLLVVRVWMTLLAAAVLAATLAGGLIGL